MNIPHRTADVKAGNWMTVGQWLRIETSRSAQALRHKPRPSSQVTCPPVS